MNNPPILLIPEKTDIEFEQVAAAWQQRGGQVKKLGKYWVKLETLAAQPVALYGNQAFAFVLAQLYNATLISPDDTLIARLDTQWTKRKITHTHISALPGISFPVFIKPVIPKLFVAGIFETPAAFAARTAGLQQDDEILVSDIVTPIQAEARAFVMHRTIMDIALYEGEADTETGSTFLQAFLRQHTEPIPEVLVIDLAFNPETGWFILEFNACWGAGLNNCSAEKVIDCIIQATQPV